MSRQVVLETHSMLFDTEDEAIIDRVELASYILAAFDGSERMAAEVRGSMLRAAHALPLVNPERELLDSLVADLQVAVVAMSDGSESDGLRKHLIDRWQGLVLQIKRRLLH
jgi:hypothetical protein